MNCEINVNVQEIDNRVEYSNAYAGGAVAKDNGDIVNCEITGNVTSNRKQNGSVVEVNDGNIRLCEYPIGTDVYYVNNGVIMQ